MSIAIAKLGTVATVIMGQSPPGDTYNTTGKGMPFFQGKSEFGEVNPVPVKWCVSPTRTASAGDILISVRAPVGPTNLADQECCIGRGLAAIRPDPAQIDRDYLWLFLRHSESVLEEMGQGSTFESINGNVLRDLSIAVPTLEVQRWRSTRLMEQLSEVNAATKVAQTQAQDITRIRSRVLQEVFAGLQDVPRKVLGDHAPTTSGTTPSRSNKLYWEPPEIPWVKTGEVAFAPIKATEEFVSKRALADCSLSLLPAKTVLVAMYGQGKTRGQSAILEVPATTNQACFAVLPNETWQPEFLYYWLMTSYQDLRDLSEDRGGNQANLNGALLKVLEVPAPDHHTQQRIVQRVQAALAEVDAMQAASRQMLKDLEQLPQRILAQAFDSQGEPHEQTEHHPSTPRHL